MKNSLKSVDSVELFLKFAWVVCIEILLKFFDFIAGDGGEDVCCSLESSHLEITNVQDDGSFEPDYIDFFMANLKVFFLGGLAFPSVHMKQRFF